MNEMFQKEFNDEISVKDVKIPNPAPTMLDEHYPTPDTKVFTAKPFHVLKLVFSDSNSLSAFSKDQLYSFYVVHPRDHKEQKVFLSHLEQGGPESLTRCQLQDLDEEARSFVPGAYL